MSSGWRAMIGTKRSICTLASTRSSPSRESPATSARTVPIGTPMARPQPTRCSEAQSAACRVPSRARSTAGGEHGGGPARTFGLSQPSLRAPAPRRRRSRRRPGAARRRVGCPSAAGRLRRSARSGGRRRGRRGPWRRAAGGTGTALRRARWRAGGEGLGCFRGGQGVGHEPCASATMSLNRPSNSWRDVDRRRGSGRPRRRGRRASAAVRRCRRAAGRTRSVPFPASTSSRGPLGREAVLLRRRHGLAPARPGGRRGRRTPGPGGRCSRPGPPSCPRRPSVFSMAMRNDERSVMFVGLRWPPCASGWSVEVEADQRLGREAGVGRPALEARR